MSLSAIARAWWIARNRECSGWSSNLDTEAKGCRLSVRLSAGCIPEAVPSSIALRLRILMSALPCWFYEGNEYFRRPIQQQLYFIRMFIYIFIETISWKSAESDARVVRLACLIIMKVWFKMAIQAEFYKLEAIRISRSCCKHPY